MTDLIAETESTPGTEGGGYAADVYTAVNDLVQDGVSWNTAFDAATVGLDYLTWAEDPFGGLIAAGVGWLLEHMPVLSDVWDRLAGDAGKIEQTSATWMNVARALDGARTSYTATSTEIERWQGTAADSYRQCAQAFESSIGGAATQAQAFAYVVQGVGALVATIKDLVYTLISSFIEETVIPAVLSALASAWFTFGSSIGIAIAYIEVQADICGVRVTERIAVGSQEVVVVSEKTLTSVTKLLDASDKVAAFAKKINSERNWSLEAVKALTHAGLETGKGDVSGETNSAGDSPGD